MATKGEKKFARNAVAGGVAGGALGGAIGGGIHEARHAGKYAYDYYGSPKRIGAKTGKGALAGLAIGGSTAGVMIGNRRRKVKKSYTVSAFGVDHGG